ncbi:hypothetical protein AX17_001784 [Amanita inopinata Kibby_2008]|nr:hypothetical protein AX17_001784 [Amanita inopinata Kibby_2008]
MFTNRNRLLQQQRQQQIELQRKQAKTDRVRKLWSEFEQWLKQPRSEMGRERDHLLRHSGPLNGHTVRASRRRLEETHFLQMREEWQRRLKSADLEESDWEPMTDVEMKAVEEALGVDDEEGYITDPSPSPPHQPIHSSTTSNIFAPAEHSANSSVTSLINGNTGFFSSHALVAAPPLTPASRSSSMSSTYECIRPEEFHSDDELTSDSDFSSFSSTISTIISEEDEAVGPVTEYMFAQALEGSSLAGNHPDNLDDNAPFLSRSLPTRTSNINGMGGLPPAPPKRPPDTIHAQAPEENVHGPSTQRPNNSKDNAMPKSILKSHISKPARIHYPLVAPSVSDLSDYDDIDNDADPKSLSPSTVAQFEAAFEARRLEIRVEKINEFHRLACEADVQLCVDIANGRRNRTLTRQEESRLVNEHYQQTISLRERMEKERKDQVNREKKRLREEFGRRNASSSSLFGNKQGSRQGRFAIDSQESDTDPEDELQKKLEKVKQEQLAMQAKFNSQESSRPQPSRGRAGTITAETAPNVTPSQTNGIAVNGKTRGDLNPASVPISNATPGSAWSTKPVGSGNSNGRGNIIKDDAIGKAKATGMFETAEHWSGPDNRNVNLRTVNGEDEYEEDNGSFWSSLSLNGKKKAPAPPPQSPWNSAGTSKSLQKQNATKSKLGIVTSAWDDNLNDNESQDNDVTTTVGREDPEVLQPDKTPVMPSAPAPVVTSNKKQTKKLRQANNKKGANAATPTTAAKNGKTDAPTSVSSTQKAQQQQSKAVPVSVPNKSPMIGKKLPAADAEDLSSTPRPSILRRLQAQLAAGESIDDDEEDLPATPRPGPGAERPTAQSTNPWARASGKGFSSAANNSYFADDGDDDMDASPGATSSRTTLDQMNGRRNNDPPTMPGGVEYWTPISGKDNKSRNRNGSITADVRKAPAVPLTAASTAAIREIGMTKNRTKGKQPANGARNTTNVWGKRTTVEEVPDDEDDGSRSKSETERLPYDSRSILELRTPATVDQPKILEPKPSKPRTMFENIFQYGEDGRNPMMDELRDGLSWDDDKIFAAAMKMARENAEMEKMLHDHPGVTVKNPAVEGATRNGGLANAIGEAKPAGKLKQLRWTPSTFDLNGSAKPTNKMSMRNYEDEAFSPAVTSNGFGVGSFGATTNGTATGWPTINGFVAVNGRHPERVGNPDLDHDDELTRTARSLLDNIQMGVGSKVRNKPGFGAV